MATRELLSPDGLDGRRIVLIATARGSYILRTGGAGNVRRLCEASATLTSKVRFQSSFIRYY